VLSITSILLFRAGRASASAIASSIDSARVVDFIEYPSFPFDALFEGLRTVPEAVRPSTQAHS
jgi:hypothetical protein